MSYEVIEVVSLATLAALGLLVAYQYYLITRLRKRLDVLIAALNSKALKSYVKAVEARQKKKDVKRYLVVKALDGVFDRRRLSTYIRKAIASLYGTATVSLADPEVLYVNKDRGKFVVRFRSPYRWKLLVALGLLQKTEGVILVPIRITGTLDKARRLADE
jgi:RNase P/RNase MRP subunit POP5